MDYMFRHLAFSTMYLKYHNVLCYLQISVSPKLLPLLSKSWNKITHCQNDKGEADAYSEPCQTSKTKLFVKIVNG